VIVRLYDGFNYFRAVVETDQTSLAPRRLYQDMVRESGVLHVWLWDGVGSRKRRQAIFPAYKAKRLPPAEDIHSSIMLFRDLLKHSTAYQLELEGIEADDLIATLVDHYAPQAKRVEIFSNDYDLMALTRANVFCGAKPKDGVKVEDIQTYKAFVGDPSDGVPGVKGFGAKAWEAADKKVLRNIAVAAVDGQPFDHLLPLMFRGDVRGEASIKAWITANAADLSAMYRIVGFMPVSVAACTNAIYRPIHDPERVQAMLKEFLL
jgi:hypothetical protein